MKLFQKSINPSTKSFLQDVLTGPVEVDHHHHQERVEEQEGILEAELEVSSFQRDTKILKIIKMSVFIPNTSRSVTQFHFQDGRELVELVEHGTPSIDASSIATEVI